MKDLRNPEEEMQITKQDKQKDISDHSCSSQLKSFLPHKGQGEFHFKECYLTENSHEINLYDQ